MGGWSAFAVKEGCFMDWDRYCEAYLERKREVGDVIEDLSAELRVESAQDIDWIQSALEDEEKKWFVASVFRRATNIPEPLFAPLLRAAVYERDASFNRFFVDPCIDHFGPLRVNQVLLDYLTQGTNFEKAGAANALYFASFSVSDPLQEQDLVALKQRRRTLLLQEFVNNDDLDVRRSIVSLLDLDAQHYSESIRPLIGDAVQIARAHPDAYIRHRIEVQLGSGGPFAPLPHREDRLES
jgi:hypothetical protein